MSMLSCILVVTKILCGGFIVTDIKKIDVLWDDNPVDISAEANFIWSIANKLRGTYMPDKYGDVIIPMTISAVLSALWQRQRLML